MMGCFLGCFGGRKNGRRRRIKESDQAETNKKLSLESARTDRVSASVEEIPKSSVIPITETCDEAEEKYSPGTSKIVNFDSQDKIESAELLGVEKEGVKLEEERSSNPTETGKSSSENSDVALNTSGVYPSSHRYQNCRESDDELEEDELFCDEDDEEYSSDDGFDEDKLHSLTKEVIGVDDSEEIVRKCNESVGDDGNNYPHGVLNPVENLSQWKSAESNGKALQKPSQKENSNSVSSITEPKKPRNQELTVDASLSTWLSTSETDSECNSVSITPEISSKQVICSHDDRPILCALSLEEIRQFSATSTPRKSPSKSPDETPIIGTVGGFWSNHSKAIDCGSESSFKGIPNTTSKYREDKSVNWHSTPFEARLEKALNYRDK